MLQIPTSARQARAHAHALCLRRVAFARLWRAIAALCVAQKKAAPLKGRPECCG
jgi:hypothetical protein